MSTSIGAKLIKYRKDAKLTQQEVAERLNIKTNTYGSWEADKTEPSGNYFPKLCDIFGVTIDKLFPDVRAINIAPNQTNHDNAKPINAYQLNLREEESLLMQIQSNNQTIEALKALSKTQDGVIKLQQNEIDRLLKLLSEKHLA